jgi:hypothetical protein
MAETAQITLILDEDERQKLAELAGGESKIADYLICVGLKLHLKKCAPGGAVDLEQAILEIDDLLNKQRMYKQKIYILQQKLGQTLAAQRQLLAIVDDGRQQRSPQINPTLH